MKTLPLCILLLSLPALAATDRAAPIAPFIDDRTILVAHLDVARLDLAAHAKQVAAAIESAQAPAPDKAAARAMIDGGLAAATLWTDAFKTAGGRDLYVIVSLADLPREPFFVVPLAAGADPKALARLLPGAAVAEQRDGCLVWAEPDTLARLKALKPAPRDAVAEALAAHGDAPFARLVYVPSDDVRRALAEMLPSLPPELGAAPIGPVARDVRWAALCVTPAPSTAITLTLQCADPAAAHATAAAITRVEADLNTIADAQLKLAPAAVRNAVGDLGAAFKALAPFAQADRVTISLAGGEFRRAAGALVPGIMAARDDARRAVALGDARQLLVAAHAYAAAHAGQFPPDLDALLKASDLSPELLARARFPGGYVYVRPAALTAPATRVVLYEAAPADDRATPLVVGYADGHAQTMPRPDLEKALTESPR